MIRQAEIKYIEQNAYIPEHIPQYVAVISQAEPFILENFLIYLKKDHLIFIGYPLKETFDEKRIEKALKDSISCFHPKTIALIAPSIPSKDKNHIICSFDQYYRLDLHNLLIAQKVRNMIKRAERELFIEKSRDFDEQHKIMVDEFLKAHLVDEGTRFIFSRLKEYVSSSTESLIFNVRNERGELVAFDIAEFGTKQYAFYMFNFRSKTHHVPGASDLLLYEIIKVAKNKDKMYLNLGLGINLGVTFFKKKWGGVPFLPYTSCIFHTSADEDFKNLLQRL